MIPRHISTILTRVVKQYPITTLTGPRQSGKTTLLRHLFHEHEYVSLEAPDSRRFALEDPRGFIDQFKDPVILDEVQQVPDLFSYLQVHVDEQQGPGQFILSGSQNFLLMRRISQSLAGRAYIGHLMPFSLAELQHRPLRTDKNIGNSVPRSELLDGDWPDLAITGFYPPIHDRSLIPAEWLAQYFQSYLQRDVRDLTQVGDLESYSRFVTLCAGRSGQLLNLSGLGNDCGISHDTARRWLSMLETSFVVFRLQPHHANFNKRLTKSAKLYFLDTGLLCFLLQIENARQLRTHAMRGMIFENFVIAELLKSYYNSGRDPRLAFWRDHRGNEVDLIIESASGPMPVEIKSGATIATDFFKGLRYWGKLAERQNAGVLVYGGDSSMRRDGYEVRSWRQWP